MPRYRYPEMCPMRVAAPRIFNEDGTVQHEPARATCTRTFLHDGCHVFELKNRSKIVIMGDWSWGSKKECKERARREWDHANGFPGVEPDQDP